MAFGFAQDSGLPFSRGRCASGLTVRRLSIAIWTSPAMTASPTKGIAVSPSSSTSPTLPTAMGLLISPLVLVCTSAVIVARRRCVVLGCIGH